MNRASEQRLGRAKAVAAVYAGHPKVQAIVLAGSVARGTAHDASDIDLGIFWAQVASQEERTRLIEQIGGRLHRRVNNDIRYSEDNPRRQGCIEIVEIEPLSASHRLGVDLEHETVIGTERVLAQVIDAHDPSLEKHELLSVIQDGIALHGHDLVARWQEKTGRHPDALAQAMVAQNLLGISGRLLALVHPAGASDWFLFYQGLLNVGRRLLLALMALNRIWAFTDNPDFGGFGPVVKRFALKPEQFTERLGKSLQSEAFLAIQGFAALHKETLDLVETHLPAVDTSGEREMLQQIGPRIAQAR